MSFLAVIFVFSFLVVIHELGHFIAAKLMGVRVERFSVGFPPRVFGKKYGDTDYCISAIPLGGYVKMSGMIDESMDTESTGADYEFNSKPVWKRVVIITGGVIMNFVLAVLVLSVLNFTKGKNVIPFTEIGAVGKAGIAQKIGLETGDKILSIGGASVHNWNDIQQEYIRNLGQDFTISVERKGQTMSLMFRKEWFSQEKAEQLDVVPGFSSKIGLISPDMPASKAGIQRGDEITEIAGVPINNWMDLTREVRKHPGEEILVRWKRDNNLLEAKLAPKSVTETDSAGNEIKIGLIGVGYYYDHLPVGAFEAISTGFTGTLNLIGLNMRAMWWWISGTKSAKEIIGGPIMIAKMAGDAAAAGWDQLWYLIAALSAVLAFFNILPIPALDGGHLILLIYEGIFRKPISTKARLVIQQIGMAVLLTFIVFVLYTDLRRLFF